MADAIARTLVRLCLTRRPMLEWTTAAQAKTGHSLDMASAYRRMRGALLLAGAGGVLVAVVRPESWAVAAPFGLLWGLSPLVARWVSRPLRVDATRVLSPGDARVLRSTARRTWRFFETFVGPDDHFLPPDNFQEDPKPVVARRTSPTNIGLYLLSTLAARDLGWLGTVDTVARLESTLATRRTQPAGPPQPVEACRALPAGLGEPPASLADWAARLGHLAAQAETLVDISRVLTAERGDGADSDLLVWAQAARATIASHQHDLETITPWAAHLEAVLTDLAKAPPEARKAIEPLLALSLTPAETSSRCEVAIGALTTLREAGLRDGSIRGDEIARIDETLGLLERSAVASRALVRRLSAMALGTKQLADRRQLVVLR